MKRVKVEFHNFPRGVAPLLARSADTVLKTMRAGDGGRISITAVPDAQIRKLNKKYRRVDRVTDVISFCLSKKPLCGDVYIAKGRSKQQSKEFGNTWAEELCYLVLHGVLHVFGYSDYAPAQRRRMFAVQDKLFKKMARKNKC